MICPRNEYELNMFEKEINALNELSRMKCNVPKAITGLEKADGLPVYFYIMEYINGISLKEYISKNPLPWSLTFSLKMLYSIANSLMFPAAMSYVHRDLHPGNILLSKNFDIENYDKDNNGLFITDFGCHKNHFLYEFIGEYFGDNFRHIGALSTWSPEFIKDPQSVKKHHDIWSLGVLIYLFLTNKYPIHANSFQELYNKLVLNLEIDFSPIESKGINWVIVYFISKLLSPIPENRPAQGAILAIIENILNERLLRADRSIIINYLDSSARLAQCLNCGRIMIPDGTRCTHCGLFCDDFLLPF